MPGVAYKGFCFATPEDVGNAMVSDPFSVNGIAVIRSYTLNATKDTMTINIYGINPSNWSAGNANLFIYPKSPAMSCPDSKIGQYLDGFGFNSLTQLFDSYFAFDLTTFDLLIGGSLGIFALGFGSAYVAKILGWDFSNKN